MFPDSNIAKTFTCGPNKIAYIARFGLADFIKRELIRALTGPYVLMFDESFNSTTKSKQLDLHVLFWSNGYVQSRFMGHGTAQDLLKLIKVRNEEFLTFQPFEKRLDTFLHERLSRLYPASWDFCQKLLLLSHGQASVERGFSVNKEVEAENMQEDTIVTHRLICDCHNAWRCHTGSPHQGTLSICGCRLFLDQERIRKEKESQSQKRKLTEQSLEDLKKRKKSLEDVSTCLAREADSLAEEAEGKAGSKMAQLLSKSNALRRAYKEKLAQVKILETEIGTKKEELRHM
ncbi:hypothetical protein MHYP_G00018590 [Metynnis hypsauchen]